MNIINSMKEINSIKKHITIFLIIIVGALLTSCSANQKKEQQLTYIVTDVNGEGITLEELNQRHYLFKNSMSKYQFLNDVVIPHKLLLQKAQKIGLSASTDEVEKAFSLLLEKKNVPEETFMQNIKEAGLTKKRTYQLLGEQVIVAKLLKQIISEVRVSEEEAYNFYRENSESFTSDGKVIPFKDVEKAIIEMLAKVKQEIQVREYVTQLGQEGNVIMYEPLTSSR